MPAALVELLPELVLGLIFFAAVVSYCAGRGLLVMWEKTLGAMLLWVARYLNWSVTVFGKHIGFDFGHVFVTVNALVKNAIEDWIKSSEEGMARTLRAMTAVWEAGLAATEWLAKEVALTLEHLFNSWLPRLLRALEHRLHPLRWIHEFERLLMPLVRSAIRLAVRAVEKSLPALIIAWILRMATQALPGVLGIPDIWKEIRGLTKRNLRINKRLHKLETYFGAAVFAGYMANALGLGHNWRCITRGNIGKVARRLCGLSPAALEDLLGLIADVVIVADICRVIELLSEGLTLIEGPINTFVGVVDGALCHGDYSAPPALPAMALSLPPSVSLALSLP